MRAKKCPRQSPRARIRFGRNPSKRCLPRQLLEHRFLQYPEFHIRSYAAPAWTATPELVWGSARRSPLSVWPRRQTHPNPPPASFPFSAASTSDANLYGLAVARITVWEKSPVCRWYSRCTWLATAVCGIHQVARMLVHPLDLVRGHHIIGEPGGERLLQLLQPLRAY